jgi:hypothetical protein
MVEINEQTMAAKIADVLLDSERFQMVDMDWNDPNEVTVRIGAKTFRVTVQDITEEQ